MATIACVQAFDQIYSMTRGGPFFSTETLAYLLYRKGFQDLDFGYASAVAWVLTAIVFIVSPRTAGLLQPSRDQVLMRGMTPV